MNHAERKSLKFGRSEHRKERAPKIRRMRRVPVAEELSRWG